MKIPLVIVSLAILAGGGAAAASQGSLPGDTFFPVKIAVEKTRAALAIGPEAEAELELRFAQKRLEEVKDLLEGRGLETDGLENAISRLEESDLRAVEAVLREKARGGNADDLALKVDDSLNSVEGGLRDLLRAEENTLRGLEDDLKAQISELKDRGDEASAEQLKVLLREVHARRVLIEAKRESLGDLADDRHLELRGGLDDNSIAWRRLDAQEAIGNAERERADLLRDAARQNLVISNEQVKMIDDLLLQAKVMFDQNRFREAKLTAKQSRDLSRNFEDQLIDLDRSGLDSPNNSGSSDNNSGNSGPGRSDGIEDSLNQSRSGELELRGREAEGETEQRGREAEGETELRGRENEGELEHRGGEFDPIDDSRQNRGGSDDSGSTSSGRGGRDDN